MSRLVGILLAAGSASRFGADKLLHPLPDEAEITTEPEKTGIDDITRFVGSYFLRFLS